MTATTMHPLALALGAAVPLEIERLRALDDEQRARVIAQHTGRPIAERLGERGDVLLFGGPGCGETFAHVAVALACLAWAPGGVTVAGMHFCARHEECRAAEAAS